MIMIVSVVTDFYISEQLSCVSMENITLLNVIVYQELLFIQIIQYKCNYMYMYCRSMSELFPMLICIKYYYKSGKFHCL